ncbi:Gfo/Idh/MocA family oxidoreductase [Candidatus Bathyarchaeota archaeon]|nr:Gfo/Idh/MocA family oxidoreductase [Candidatus Bathyarchaeota archaeon]
MNRRIRVGVIGTGEIASKAHIPALLSNRNVDLVALVDTNNMALQRVGKRFGVSRLFSSVDGLFAKLDVDAVIVCTPPSTHEDVTVKALSYGAHVLCEKPLATNVDEGKRMIKASQTNQRILTVGFQRRFWPNYHKAKELISVGRVGHVYCAEDCIISPNPLVKWGKSDWFYKPGVGGVILDLASHSIDMLNYVFGDFPIAVSASGSAYLDSPVEEYCACLLEYPRSRVGIGLLSWLSPIYMEQLNIHGTAQNLFVTPHLLLKTNPTDISELSSWWEATKLLISLKFPNLFPSSSQKVDIHRLEVDDFVRQVMKGQISFSNALNALNVTIACEGVKRALETNRRIEISSVSQL